MNIPFQGRDFVLGNPDSMPRVSHEDFSHNLSTEYAHGPPKDFPEVHKQDYFANQGPDDGDGPDPPVCIPPIEDALFQEGGTIPTLQLGDNIVVQSESANGITAPVFYQWTLNGVPTVTTATYPYTVVDGDIQGKDEEGIGYIEFTQTVSNACGLVTNVGSFPAQGTPPP